MNITLWPWGQYVQLGREWLVAILYLTLLCLILLCFILLCLILWFDGWLDGFCIVVGKGLVKFDYVTTCVFLSPSALSLPKWLASFT